jgi:hypothetical protein
MKHTNARAVVLNGRYTNHKYLEPIKPIVLVDLPAFDIFL